MADTWGGSWGSSWATSWTPAGAPAATASRGGWSNYKLTKREKEYLTRLRLQQSRLRDDEEALVIILASITRKH